MEYIYLYLSIIVYTIFILYVGFKVALLRWNHKENQQKIENYENINTELTSANKSYIEILEKVSNTSKSNKDWYIGQLRNISYYLKEKYSDDFLEVQLYDIFNNSEKEIIIESEKKEYDINIILEKISKNGIESLTEEEINFLKNNKK